MQLHGIYLLLSTLSVVHGTSKFLVAPMTLEEEKPRNTLVGVITDSDQWKYEHQNTPKSELTFSFLKKTRTTFYFRVDKSTGKVYTRSRIDRDKLCVTSELCCDDRMERDTQWKKMVCHLEFTVRALSDTGKFTLVNVQVKLVDLNDNTPRWLPNKIERQVRETQEINVEVDLPLARDADSGRNGIVLYKLKEQAPRAAFALRTVRDQDGRGENIVKLQLVSTQVLDRETKSFYVIKVEAEDGDGRTALLTVNVTIIDVNDCKPQFVNATKNYYIRVSENAGTHKRLLQLKVVDKDIGENGRITYRIGVRPGERRASRQDIHRLFMLEPDSGVLLLTGKLDYETRRRHIIPVVAYDNGQPQLSSEAEVTVDVVDVNDDRPHIEVLPVKGRVPYIAENLKPDSQKIVATVLVHDGDSGTNGRVECELRQGETHFALRPVSTTRSKQMVYSLTAVATFDREHRASHSVLIFCSDSGSPPLTRQLAVDVLVNDENDSPPVFDRSVLVTKIRENLLSNTRIETIRAHDEDIGKNGMIRYSIVPPTYQFVRIDENTGTLYTKMKFDREHRDNYTFVVMATDQGKPSFSASVTVTLRIVDVNDNSPRFTPSTPRRVTVNENLHTGPVATINATDLDLGSNGRVTYFLRRLLSPTGAEMSGKRMFSLASRTGHLRIHGRLDREMVSHYVLVIEARDHGHPARTSTMSLTVEVADSNDNKPVFLYPNSASHSINISESIVEGTRLALIRAVDKDQGENGEVVFSIVKSKSNEEEYFQLDSSTGELRLARSISGKAGKVFHLQLTASDRGESAASTRQLLKIRVVSSRGDRNLMGGSGGMPHGGRGDQGKTRRNGVPNVVVLLVAGLAALVLIILILTIIYMIGRRRVARPAIVNKRTNEKQPPPAYDVIAPRRSPLMQVGYHPDSNMMATYTTTLKEPEKIPEYHDEDLSEDSDLDGLRSGGGVANTEMHKSESLTLMKRSNTLLAQQQQQAQLYENQRHGTIADPQSAAAALQLHVADSRAQTVRRPVVTGRGQPGGHQVSVVLNPLGQTQPRGTKRTGSTDSSGCSTNTSSAPGHQNSSAAAYTRLNSNRSEQDYAEYCSNNHGHTLLTTTTPKSIKFPYDDVSNV